MKNNSIKTIVVILLFSCSKTSERNAFFEKVDVAEWNQVTINLLIEHFRVDTICFSKLKQAPPTAYTGIYGYPTYANVCNNDIATAWSFLNKRNVLLQTLDTIAIQTSSMIEINEYYSLFYRKADYEITDGVHYYEISINDNGKKTIKQQNEQSEIVRGFVDNRSDNLKPLKNLCVKSVIDLTGKEARITIKSIYIDDFNQ